MARTIRNAKLDSRSGRAKLLARPEPYWTVISRGCALGYRKGKKGGSWVARFRDENGKQRYEAIGAADDAVDPNGGTVLSFPQAQERVRDWIGRQTRESAEPSSPTRRYTVGTALDDYVRDYKRRSTAKSLYVFERAIEAHIRPAFGDVEVDKLTNRDVQDWLDELATCPARLRSKRGEAQKFKQVDDTPEGVRKRRSSANKILTVLKAALNLAYRQGLASNDHAWSRVPPFRNVEAARVRYLSDEEARLLVKASPPAFGALTTAALLTGCRYGELRRLCCRDFQRDAQALYIADSKSGKPRHVHLTAEGILFFEKHVADRAGGELLFVKENGTQWQRTDQARAMRQVCKAAQITPPVGFHILRHTYGSRLAMQGVPMAVIAAQLGHSDTRITEKHYAHLGPSYVAATIRGAFTEMHLS